MLTACSTLNVPVIDVVGGSREHNAAEVGTAEGALLEQAPRSDWPSASVVVLREEGCALVPDALSSASAAALRNHCEEKRASSLRAVADGVSDETDHFGVILARGSSRCDLKLELDPVVSDALAEALESLAPLVRGTLESDEEPVLAELGAIYSTEGAPRQPLHSDTRRTEGSADLLTAFVALQDIDERMGPTTFLPGTHRDPVAHAAVVSPELKADLLRKRPVRFGTMPVGACTLYDSRLLHAGGANHDARGRWLLYAGFAASRELMRELRGNVYEPLQRGAHTLEQLQQSSAASEGEEEWEAVWSALLRPRETVL